MTTLEILTKLKGEKYPLLLVSEQAEVDYMRLYRFFTKGKSLTEQEEGRIRAFAFLQPCFTRSGDQ